jgi:hypothetical protein
MNLRTIADCSTTRQQFSIFAEYKHLRLRVAEQPDLSAMRHAKLWFSLGN